MASMRMDTHVTGYATHADLDVYVHGSAAVIGLQMLPVLGTTGPREEAEPYAAALGVAFQLTNFLRDVGEDLDRGRVYLPADELAAFGVDRDLLTWCRRTRRPDPRVRRALAHLVARTRAVYRRAEPGVGMLEPVSRACVACAFTLYQGILDEIEAADYDVLHRRVAVPGGRRARVALSALARAGLARAGSAPAGRAAAGSERHRLRAALDLAVAPRAQRLDRRARQRVVLGEQPPQDVRIVVAAVAEHGDRARQALDHGVAGEEVGRDDDPVAAQRQQLAVADELVHPRDTGTDSRTATSATGRTTTSAASSTSGGHLVHVPSSRCSSGQVVDVAATDGVLPRSPTVRHPATAMGGPGAPRVDGTVVACTPHAAAPCSTRATGSGRCIARGGMSTVYRGTDTRLDRPVAIKVMDARLAGDPAFRTRFEREARSAARIDHPAVVDVHDQGDDLRRRRAGAVPRHGARRGRHAARRAPRPRRARRARRRWPCSNRCWPGSRRPTASASCTATSSRRTC